MLQEWIKRLEELSRNNSQEGQWKHVATGTHGTYIADTADELIEKISMGQPAFYEADDLPNYSQSPYEEQLFSIPGIVRPIPRSQMWVYLKDQDGDRKD